ncbi:MAG: S41 family peptidase [Chloroflexi bacterium]|nr:S41 family peptidase [Chloroflexota bacterium]
MLRAARLVVFTLLMVVVLGLAFTAGFGTAQSLPTSPRPLRMLQGALGEGAAQDQPRHFKLLGEIWETLQQDYVDPKALDPDKLGRSAIEGMITALGDPHTTYIDAQSYALERTSFQQSYEGIGAHVTQNGDEIIIVAPIAGSPAEAAGLRPGDRILEVNGESTKGMNLADAVAKIKGPGGTRVRLVVLHDGESAPTTVEITRAQIKTGSVFTRMLPDNIAHIRITQFGQRTGTELRDALREVKGQGARAIVLDLRNNPGGLLDTTVEAASQFLQDGVVAYQVDRNGNRESWKVRSGGEAPTLPLAVLVNQGSASGSEVLAGAIQDRGRGAIIGTKTFGKGSVNHIRELSDGSALYVTIARWLTPKEQLIEGNGLTPDIVVPVTEEDIRSQRDPQLERSLEYLREQLKGG